MNSKKEHCLKVRSVTKGQMILGALNDALSVIRKFHPKCEGEAWCRCTFCSDSDLMAAEFVAESYTQEELADAKSLSGEAIDQACREAALNISFATFSGRPEEITRHMEPIIRAAIEKAVTK
jgi:hypothetical protein